MAKIINLKTFTDSRGNLTVIEKIIPFEIKRIFYIYGVDNSVRGHHRHKKTIQAAVSIQGKCKITNQAGLGYSPEEFILDSPSKCLIINPTDYHWMHDFSKDCILMVLASEYFDENDYIYENYND
jgi:hypothetical protein